MHVTKHDLPEGTRRSVVSLLNARLADAIDLRMQAKQAHWNVKGPNFDGLHRLFDEIVDAVDEYVDELAERAVQLGGVARGTARMAAAASTLAEYPENIAAGADHAAALAAALAQLGRLAREGIDRATELRDAGTADLFTEISRGLDKWLWMVESHLTTER